MRKLIGRNISILYRNKQHFADLKLMKYHLNKAQAEVLLFLNDDNGVNQTELNEFFLYNKATITKIITHLEKYEYVRRVAGQKDRREKEIFLTETGRDVLSVIIEVLDSWTDLMVEGIPEADVETLKILLAKMVENTINWRENE